MAGRPAAALGAAIALSILGPGGLCEDSRICDWPCWLGPGRDGTSPEKGLLRQWPQGGPAALWTVDVPQGYGVPTVSGAEVFLLGGGAKARSVVSLDAVTGRQLWRFDYEGSAKSVSWGYCPRATVAASPERVWSLDEMGLLYCLDRRTGREVWKKDVDAAFEPSHNDWKGWSCSPVLAGGVLVLNAGSAGIVGMKPETGEVLWKSAPGSGWTYQTPQVVNFAGNECVVASREHPAALVAIGARDGAEVWTHKLGNISPAPAAASPHVIDGRFILETPRKAPAALVSVAFDQPPFATKQVWRSDKLQACYAMWARSGNHVYGFNHARPANITGPYLLGCADLSSGELVWEKEGFEKGVSLIAADGLLFARSGPLLLLYEATPEGPAEKGRIDLGFKGDDGWVMPAMAWGRLYVRARGKLTCFQVAAKAPSAAEVAGALARKR